MHDTVSYVHVCTCLCRARCNYSNAFYWVLHHIYENFRGCILDINRWSAHAETFADAVFQKCAHAPGCVGFIDGTFRSCCRPTEGQRLLYSGYKKKHGVKFQSVVAPNGMIMDLYGALPGKRGDSYMLRRSGLLGRMATLCATLGLALYVYGDPAYPLSQYVLRGFKGLMTPQQRAFSRAMSQVRETVEWSYHLVVTQWAYVDVKSRLKIKQQPVGRIYFVAALLQNMHTCLYGNQIFTYFGEAFPALTIPSLETYLQAGVIR